MTARALVLSALADGPSTLRRPLRARDTELMAGRPARAWACSVSTVRRRALGGPARGRCSGPAHVDVGLAGTVMRFLPPVAALADGPVTFDGDPHARQPPAGARWSTRCARSASGIDAAPTGGLPLTVHGTGRVAGGEVVIDASASSQLVSGLLLAAPDFDRGRRGAPRRARRCRPRRTCG